MRGEEGGEGGGGCRPDAARAYRHLCTQLRGNDTSQARARACRSRPGSRCCALERAALLSGGKWGKSKQTNTHKHANTHTHTVTHAHTRTELEDTPIDWPPTVQVRTKLRSPRPMWSHVDTKQMWKNATSQHCTASVDGQHICPQQRRREITGTVRVFVFAFELKGLE